MATDAIVVTNSQLVEIETPALTPIVQLAPMQPGRNYLVWASGELLIENALVNIELEAFGAKDSITLADRLGHHAYTLTVGTSLPADEDLFTVAKVSASILDAPNPAEPGRAVTINGRLVVLAVDSVTVQGT